MSNLNDDQFDLERGLAAARDGFELDEEWPEPPGYEGQPLFHGTIHEIKDNRVLPSAFAGKEVNFEGLSDPYQAYATESEDIAWQMADTAQSKWINNTGWDDTAPRSHVAKVRPVDGEEPQMGYYHSWHPEYSGEDLQEWTSSTGFDVTDRVDIKPGHQGTFPLNWNQFDLSRGRTYGDPNNHPDDYAVESSQVPTVTDGYRDVHRRMWNSDEDTQRSLGAVVARGVMRDIRESQRDDPTLFDMPDVSQR